MKKRLTNAQKLWLEALESGEYKQTTGWLYRKGSYCCLGVACKLYNEENNKKVRYRKHAHLESLPMVKKWLGLNSDEGTLGDIPKVQAESLATLNDHGSSFKDIAKIVRANPDKVFI